MRPGAQIVGAPDAPDEIGFRGIVAELQDAAVVLLGERWHEVNHRFVRTDAERVADEVRYAITGWIGGRTGNLLVG